MRKVLLCSLSLFLLACESGSSSGVDGGTSKPPVDAGAAGQTGAGGAVSSQASGGTAASGGSSHAGGSTAGTSSGPSGGTSAGGAVTSSSQPGGGTTAAGSNTGSAAGGTSKGGGTATGTSAGGTTAGTSASGGKSATGGSSKAGGTSGGSGSAGSGGTSATGGTTSSTSSTSTATAPALSCSSQLPAHTSSETVSETIKVTGVKDYNFQRLCADPDKLGPGDQSEDQKPVFMLAKGATLRNVIVGGPGCSAADGIHCESGSCTLENVWIGDVGEDAITFKGSDSSQVMTITGGGAFEASDKVIQHNGPGVIKINGFFVKNAGKLYRSCGNCSNNGFARQVEMNNIFASGVKVLAGINGNYGDTAKLTNITLCGTVKTLCETFTGNNSGDEPSSLASYGPSGGDGKSCLYSSADILK